MKITKSYLKQIIKEELENLAEGDVLQFPTEEKPRTATGERTSGEEASVTNLQVRKLKKGKEEIKKLVKDYLDNVIGIEKQLMDTEEKQKQKVEAAKKLYEKYKKMLNNQEVQSNHLDDAFLAYYTKDGQWTKELGDKANHAINLFNQRIGRGTAGYGLRLKSLSGQDPSDRY